jgi:hypothetical protein
LESVKGRDRSEELGVYGRIKIKWMLVKWVWMARIGLIWLSMGPIACSHEHCNKPFGFIKGGELFDNPSVQLGFQEGLCSIEVGRCETICRSVSPKMCRLSGLIQPWSRQ